MSGTTKRLDLQLGSFACSVQGFDDPVQPVRQVLQALQNLVEETPEISDLGIVFDAGEIDRLIGEVARRADLDEGNVEIVPGLIIVHRGDATTAGDLETEADVGSGESWSRPFVASGNDQDDEGGYSENATQDAESGFVNIFAPAAAGGDAGAEAGSALFAADEDDASAGDDPFASRLRQIGDEDDTGETDAGRADPYVPAGEAMGDAPVRNIFDEPDEAVGEDSGANIFADPMAANIAAEPADSDSAINFFASASEAAPEADETADEIASLATARIFAGAGDAQTGEAGDDPGFDDGEAQRGEVLFGSSEDQPEVEEADEGYTAAGIAEAAGAKSVDELMISAAAWMVLIQGQTTFTRHDVIDVFEGMPGDHSKTLEARIKGFGKAVRNGQLIMVEDGVFGLARTELDRFQGLL